MDVPTPAAERIDRPSLEQLQLERFQAVLNRVRRHVEYYRVALSEAGIDPGEIRRLEDIRAIPFTTRATLIEAYPYGLFAVPLREVVRLQSTPTEAGHPIVVGYSRNDLEHWAEMAARVLRCAGIHRDDVVQIMYDYDLFGGGLGLHAGAERVGASVVPASGIPADQQLAILRDYRSTATVGPPSGLLQLADALRRHEIDPDDLQIRVAIVGGEPHDELTRREIEARFEISVYRHYGLPEVMGSSIAAECLQKDGLHLFEDVFLAEVVDPDSGDPVPSGQPGELVLTTLTKEAFPLVRYRTGDIVRLTDRACPCGRTFARISPPLGRTDDRIVADGIAFFPGQVREIVHHVAGAPVRSRVVLTREGARDRVAVEVEVTASVFDDQVRKLMEIQQRIESELLRDLGIEGSARLVSPSTFDPDAAPADDAQIGGIDVDDQRV